MNNEMRDKVIKIVTDVYDRQAQICESADEIIGLVGAALTQQQEDYEELQRQYHLLASEMVYEGNSVQHWRQKALAYKECAGVIYELKSILGVETPADVLEQVKAQQQEAEPVAWLCTTKDGQVDAATTTHQKDTYTRVGREILPVYLHPPKPVAKDVEKLLRKAFELGKQWWMQADSESYKQNKLADQTMSKFEDLLSAAKEEGK